MGSASHAGDLAGPLPVYVEDNHAGTFQFLASELDLDRPHVLVLVDAHSDSSVPSVAEAIRDGLRRVVSPEEREVRLIAWRREGLVQSFDWIAPLMPRPLERVLWVGPSIGGHVPPGWTVTDLDDVGSRLLPPDPVVVSLDLDSFAGLGVEGGERRFVDVWRRIVSLPRLTAVSIAISRPWLSDDAEASRLVLLALRAALSIANVKLRFEPYGIEGPDRSERAKEFFRQGQEPPRFDPDRASPELRSFLLAHADRFEVRLDPGRWLDALARWRAERSVWRVVLDGIDAGSDRVARPPAGSGPDLRVQGGPPGEIRQVTWLQWTPTQWSYSVLPDLPLGKAFAGAAPPVVDYVATVLARTRSAALDADTWQRFLPGPNQTGVLRVSAELETDRGVEHTATLEIRQGRGTGFRRGLAEQFGLPYVFGAGFLRRGDLRGSDTGVGNDCANFLVAAWRRSGVRLPWCNPAQLRRHLHLLARRARSSDSPAIPPGALDRGLVVHLGSHVAAVWEDRPPVGVLGDDDLVVHHLGGAPEVLSLRKLLAGRTDQRFDLYVAPERKAVVWVAVGGDLMPGLASDPPRRLRDTLAKVDLFVANLETAVTSGASAVTKRYSFAIPAPRLAAVRALGVGAVSLANNHAGDYGAAGLRDTMEALGERRLGYFGAGADVQDALRPWTARLKGVSVAWIGVSLSETELLAADNGSPGVAVLPRHDARMAQALAEARRRADCVIVLVHWGEEGSQRLTDGQRRWARWLVQHGADAVVGSGPHVVQQEEAVEGAPVFYSTGNLWFAGKWPRKSRAAGVAYLGLDDRGRIVTSRLEVYR